MALWLVVDMERGHEGGSLPQVLLTPSLQGDEVKLLSKVRTMGHTGDTARVLGWVTWASTPEGGGSASFLTTPDSALLPLSETHLRPAEMSHW